MIGMFEREGDVSTFPSYYAAPLALVCGALALEGGDFAPAAFAWKSLSLMDPSFVSGASQIACNTKRG